MNVRLQGTEGGLSLFPLRLFAERHDTLVDLVPLALGDANAYEQEIAHFRRVVRGEAAPLATVQQALGLQRVIDAIYRSAASGHAERV